MGGRDLFDRVRYRARVRLDGWRAERRLDVSPLPSLVALGDTNYGGYVIPDGVLEPGSVCYLIGVGEDITFDLSLIARYGVTVHAFDPVPRAAAFAARAAAHEPRFVFHAYAVWARDEEVTFHEPFRPGYVSQSAVDLHGRPPSFTAQGRSLPSLMSELGHDGLDLLKVSAEGAEFAILDNLLSGTIRPRIVCSEFALPTDLAEVLRVAGRFDQAGYAIASRIIRPGGWKFTWVGEAVTGGGERSTGPPTRTQAGRK